MYSTTVYLVQQKHQVVMIDTDGEYFDRRYRPVYAKNLKANKGVDNVILFEFVNQDQKPVNVSGSTLNFRIINQAGNELLLSKEMVILNAQFGRVKVLLTADDLAAIDAQPASWSIERISGNLREAVFVDDYAGARGFIDIVDSVYPEFTPSGTMTIPTHGYVDYSNPNRIHTSEIYTADRNLVTFQLDFDRFTGNIKAQGADTRLGPWYDIDLQYEYDNQRDREHINVQGKHGYVRFEINQYGANATANLQVANGSVSNIALTAGGNAWFGVTTPRVVIYGNGTGATANATVANGVVSTLQLDSGGEGFIAVPQYTIDCGTITQIAYR